MAIVATSRANQNTALFDPWTVVHFSSGLALGLVGVSLPLATVIAVAYEGAEAVARGYSNSARARETFLTEPPESAANVFVDVAVLVVGARLGRAWRES